MKISKLISLIEQTSNPEINKLSKKILSQDSEVYKFFSSISGLPMDRLSNLKLIFNTCLKRGEGSDDGEKDSESNFAANIFTIKFNELISKEIQSSVDNVDSFGWIIHEIAHILGSSSKDNLHQINSSANNWTKEILGKPTKIFLKNFKKEIEIENIYEFLCKYEKIANDSTSDENKKAPPEYGLGFYPNTPIERFTFTTQFLYMTKNKGMDREQILEKMIESYKRNNTPVDNDKEDIFNLYLANL